MNPDIEFNVVSSPLRLRRILALSRPATKSKPTMFSSRVIVATPYMLPLTATIPWLAQSTVVAEVSVASPTWTIAQKLPLLDVTPLAVKPSASCLISTVCPDCGAPLESVTLAHTSIGVFNAVISEDNSTSMFMFL